MRPARSVAYQRLLSPGRRKSPVGTLSGTKGKRSTSRNSPVVGGAVNALHVVFTGRVSSPDTVEAPSGVSLPSGGSSPMPASSRVPPSSSPTGGVTFGPQDARAKKRLHCAATIVEQGRRRTTSVPFSTHDARRAVAQDDSFDHRRDVACPTIELERPVAHDFEGRPTGNYAMRNFSASDRTSVQDDPRARSRASNREFGVAAALGGAQLLGAPHLADGARDDGALPPSRRERL